MKKRFLNRSGRTFVLEKKKKFSFLENDEAYRNQFSDENDSGLFFLMLKKNNKNIA